MHKILVVLRKSANFAPHFFARCTNNYIDVVGTLHTKLYYQH